MILVGGDGSDRIMYLAGCVIFNVLARGFYKVPGIESHYRWANGNFRRRMWKGITIKRKSYTICSSFYVLLECRFGQRLTIHRVYGVNENRCYNVRH